MWWREKFGMQSPFCFINLLIEMLKERGKSNNEKGMTK